MVAVLSDLTGTSGANYLMPWWGPLSARRRSRRTEVIPLFRTPLNPKSIGNLGRVVVKLVVNVHRTDTMNWQYWIFLA